MHPGKAHHLHALWISGMRQMLLWKWEISEEWNRNLIEVVEGERIWLTKTEVAS